MSCLLQFHGNFLGRRSQRKKALSMLLRATGSGYSEVQAAYTLQDERERGGAAGDFQTISQISPIQWDTFRWDAFKWDDAGIAPERLKISGRGEVFNLTILVRSTWLNPMTLYGATIKALPGRVTR